MPGFRAEAVYHCVGIRSLGTSRPDLPFGGRAAGRPGQRAVKYLTDAGRQDLIPGSDGTVRQAYRRLEGWRVDRRRLAEAVGRHAPGLPVIDGPDFPPAITRADAMAARRQRRSGASGRWRGPERPGTRAPDRAVRCDKAANKSMESAR